MAVDVQPAPCLRQKMAKSGPRLDGCCAGCREACGGLARYVVGAIGGLGGLPEVVRSEQRDSAGKRDAFA